MQHHITTRRINALSLMLVAGVLLMGAAFQYGGIKHDLVSTVTSASSLVLTNTSTQVQRLTGSTAQAVVLPNAQTSRVGWWFEVSNDSSATTTVQNFNNQIIGTIAAGNSAKFYLTSTSTTGGPWDLLPGNGSSGGGGGSSGSFWTGFFTAATGDWRSAVAYPGPGEFEDNAATLTELFNPSSWTVTKYGDKPGITFTAPSTGYIQTCVNAPINFNNANAYGLVELYDGTNSAGTTDVGNTGNLFTSYYGCIITQVTASSSYNIRLRGSTSNTYIYINSGLDSTTTFTIRYL